MARPPLRSFFYLLLLGALLLTLALVVRSGLVASKHFDEPINAAMRAALSQDRPELTTEQALLIDKLYPTAAVSPTGLRFVVRAPGQGPKVGAGDTVTVHYSGSLLDGGVFDDSDRHGGAFTFNVGSGQVIKGWDEALVGMRKGEKRTVIVPWWLGYGAEGRPPVIPPHAILVFEIELLAF